MTATPTPDGISFSDLQDLMKDAPKERDVPTPTSPSAEREAIEAAADKALEAVSKEFKGPLVHEVMAAMVVRNLIDWHTHVGEELAKDGEFGMATAWLRDAGKCQAIMNLLFEINVGDDDFLVSSDDD